MNNECKKIRRIVHSMMIDVINETRRNTEEIMFDIVGPDVSFGKPSDSYEVQSDVYDFAFYRCNR